MKKYGTLIALAVAVVFGIIAVVLANKWLARQVGEETVVIKEQVPLEKIVIAGKDLDIGSQLTQDNLTVVDWPKANLPRGSFTAPEAVIGRVTVTKLAAGAPIVTSMLAAEGSGVGLVAMIKPGMRAMTIRVDEVVGVGGFILPNTFVDVLSVQGKGKNAETVFKKVEVLAIAQETFVEEGKAKVVRTVTMALTPKQAEKMAETINKGPIHLVLRNPAEDEVVPQPKPEPPKVAQTTAKKRVVRAPKPAPPKPETYDIVVIRGTKSVDKVQLPAGNQ